MQEASRMKETAVIPRTMKGSLPFRDALINAGIFNIFELSQRYEKYSITA